MPLSNLAFFFNFLLIGFFFLERVEAYAACHFLSLPNAPVQQVKQVLLYQ